MAAEYAADNGRYLEHRLGRQMEPVDLYLAHFLGAGGAARFLRAHDSNPGAAAAPLLAQAARANRPIFYNRDGSMRSFAEIRARFAEKIATGNQSGGAIDVSGRGYPALTAYPGASAGASNSGASHPTPTLPSVE